MKGRIGVPMNGVEHAPPPPKGGHHCKNCRFLKLGNGGHGGDYFCTKRKEARFYTDVVKCKAFKRRPKEKSESDKDKPKKLSGGSPGSLVPSDGLVAFCKENNFDFIQSMSSFLDKNRRVRTAKGLVDRYFKRYKDERPFIIGKEDLLMEAAQIALDRREKNRVEEEIRKRKEKENRKKRGKKAKIHRKAPVRS